MASEALPRSFGKYTLLSQLAVGGMADVLLATQRGPAGFEKDCVIKRILPHLAQDEAFVRMFLDEARIAARLSHPNIVQVFDFGHEGGDYFIALEYVDGLTLEKMLSLSRERGHSGVPWPIAVRIVASIAEGLDHAHNATSSDGEPLHLVHRDVSPSNIIVGWGGAAKILDFGIAKVAAHRFQRNTEVGVVKGKVPYMSPEQIEGEEIDARSDIFSLGAVLYEAVTGQRAFVGDSVGQVSQLITQHDPLPPEELNPAFPPDLKPILWRALSKQVDRRYQRARDFKLDLDQFLADQHVSCTSYDVAAYLEELAPRRGKGTLLGVGPAAPRGPAFSSPYGSGERVPGSGGDSAPSRRTPSGQAPSRKTPSKKTPTPAASRRTPSEPLPGQRETAMPNPDDAPEEAASPRPAARSAAEPSGRLAVPSFDLDAEERRHQRPKSGSPVVSLVIIGLVLVTAVVFYILHSRAVRRAEQGAPAADASAAPATPPAAPTVATPPVAPTAATPPSAATKPGEAAKPTDKAGDKPAAPAAKPATAPDKAPDKAADKPAAKPADKPAHKKQKTDEGGEAPRALPKLPTPPPADPE
ncbi:MAG: protein kinase [Polyangia bacterium]